MFFRKIPAWAACAACLLFANVSSAADLNEVLDTLTKQIKLYLQDRNETNIAIGKIQAGSRTSGGRLVETQLKEKLEAVGVKITDPIDAEWEVRGNLTNHDGVGSSLLALEVGLFDSNGAEVKGFRQRFTEAAAETREQALEDIQEAVSTANTAASLGEKIGTTSQTALVGAKPEPITEARVDAAVKSVSNVQGAVVDNPTDIARVNGVTADLASSVKAATGIDGTAQIGPGGRPPAINSDLRTKGNAAVNQTINAAIRQPSFHPATATAIAASPTSPFRIEIEATDPSGTGSYSPVSVIDRKGFAFAPLVEGQLYQVRVYNDADFDVGLELSIDGINSLALSEIESFKSLGKWVIPARSSGVVRGWLINNQRLDEFVVTAEPQGVAALLGRTQSIGMVTATFFPAWEGNAIPPFQQLLGGAKKGATGQGRPLAANIRNVIRTFGTEPLAMITVRYNNPEPPADLPNQ